jgi:thiamine biosynthesis lipoprotein
MTRAVATLKASPRASRLCHILIGMAVIATQAAADDSIVARDAYVMGTQVRLVIVDASRAAGMTRLDRALAEIEAVEAELTTWRADGELAALNAAPVGEPVAVGASLCRALGDAASWRDTTGGAFDPAIGRLIEAWDLRGDGRIPSTEELTGALNRSGLSRIAFDRGACMVTRRADATFDAGAFGKGAALDRAAKRLGDAAWMIDLGGQVAVGGRPPGQPGWMVAIADPAVRDRPALTVRLTSGSLSTSGGSERDLRVAGERIGHILDPVTGRPAAFTGSVTVWHESALAADILSTALFVMGPEQGLAWAETRGLSACFLQTNARGGSHAVATTAFRTLFSDR